MSSAPSPSKAIEFASLVGKLKTTPRTGWVRRGVPRYESVADHSWRVAMMSLLLVGTRAQIGNQEGELSASATLDVAKCIQLALVHDLAECIVGDIAPDDNIEAKDKLERETKAIRKIAAILKEATNLCDAESYLLDLFHEYELRQTSEAKAVKDLDLLDMILQADEYEQVFGTNLSEFFNCTPPTRFENELIRNVAEQIHIKRVKRMEVKTTTNLVTATSPSDRAFIEEFSKASNQDYSSIEQLVKALRAWESRSKPVWSTSLPCTSDLQPPIRILTRDSSLIVNPGASTFEAQIETEKNTQSHAKDCKSNRKSSLKNMTILDMTPAATLTKKKNACPEPWRDYSLPLNPISESAVPVLDGRNTDAALSAQKANESSTISRLDFDLTEYPALSKVCKSNFNPLVNDRQDLLLKSTVHQQPMDHFAYVSSRENSQKSKIQDNNEQNVCLMRSRPNTSTKIIAPKSPAPLLTSDPFTGLSSLRNQSIVSSAAFTPKPRDDASLGEEHSLLSLFQQGKFVIAKKGRQRIRPRKKQLTTLKKKILHERLRNWQELNIHEAILSDCQPSCHKAATTVCIFGFVDPYDLEDEDEYEEIISNLQDMAAKVGPVRRTFFPPRVAYNDSEHLGQRVSVFVEFIYPKDASAAVACWSGLSLSGQVLETFLKSPVEEDADLSDDEWREWCVVENSKGANEKSLPVDTTLREIVLKNALTDDDLEDEHCLEESLNDLTILSSRFGSVVSVRVERQPCPLVYVQYTGSQTTVQNAVLGFQSIMLGGQVIIASVVEPSSPASDTNLFNENDDSQIILDKFLTDDDVADKECLEECLADVRELALRFGDVRNVCVYPLDAYSVSVSYFDHDIAVGAMNGFNSMTFAGVSVKASLARKLPSIATNPLTQAVSGAANANEHEPISDTANANEHGHIVPMFSNNKRIPEPYAECKRVPKTPKCCNPRTYASIAGDETVKSLLSELLGELTRLQKRAADECNMKARRRIVMGLREVARGIRAHKVKLVVMANNLDEYGAIDEKLQDILNLANKEGLPVFFEFTMRHLGKAVGKSIKVAVVGVQSAEGAHQQFKKLLELSSS